ncbi:MAG: cytochrome c biogenesis protein ResB [Bacteroidetes bacterium]|nr:cytochrome c biogenesis protein ResB [Bacteroidota bacterium]
MIKNRNIWERPWEYKEGILISITILILGFMLEFVTDGRGVLQLLEYPNNLYFGLGIILFLILISITGRKWAVIEWLRSIPAAICSIGLLLFVSLLLGLTMQYDNSAPEIIRKLGLSHVVSSWPYLLANLFLLLALGLTTIKNLVSFKWSKLGFIVSHLGLWIVLFGANFGSVQMQRLQMEIPEGGINNRATDKATNQVFTMPFAIKLVDFILDEYTPKLALVNNIEGTLHQGNGNDIILIDTTKTQTLENWQITNEEYIYSSAKAGDKYYFVNEIGAAPSVFVSATNKNGKMVEGWISCGSYNRPYESLKLDEQFSLVMLLPEPKEFTSIIEIYQKDENPIAINLEVNKPKVIGDWKIYQLNYDSNMGRWSDTSVVELIKDPWLPVVYTGIFMMLVGALYMFWMGTKNKIAVVETKTNERD